MATTEKKPRPVPTPTRTTTPFWEAAKEGRFLLQYDPAAGKYQFWPRPVSVHSGSRKLEWRESSGRGKLGRFIPPSASRIEVSTTSCRSSLPRSISKKACAW